MRFSNDSPANTFGTISPSSYTPPYKLPLSRSITEMPFWYLQAHAPNIFLLAGHRTCASQRYERGQDFKS